MCGKKSRFHPKLLQLAIVRLFQDVCLHGIWFLLLKVTNQWKIIKQYNYKRNVRPQLNIKATHLFKTAPARNESQTSFRKDGPWLAKMGRWKGKQIIYSCVDLMVVFVPLVTLPFQMSEDLIWAVSKRTTWRHRGRSRTHRDGGFRRSEFSSKLCATVSWIWTELGKGMGFLILSPTWECWKEKKSSACAASGGGRSCVMADEWEKSEGEKIVGIALFVRV